MHGAKGADSGMVFHADMASQRCAIHKNRAIANEAIVCDVRVGHEHVVAADARHAAAFFCATAHGHELAKLISRANFQRNVLARKSQVLRFAADRAEGVKMILRADFRGAVYNRMRFNHAFFAELDLISNNRELADARAASNSCGFRNARARVDFAHDFPCESPLGGSRSTILHIKMASAASSLPTKAFPDSLQKV